MDKSNDPNIQIVLNLFEGTLDPSNLNRYVEFFSNDCLIHAFQNDYDIKSAKQFDASLASAFKLKNMVIEDIFSRDDRVYVYWTFNIFHKGEYEGIPATQKELTVKGMSIYRFSEGRIQEVWQFWDRLGLLEQIGEVQVKIHAAEFESHYELLKELGLEKYVEKVSRLSKRERQCLKLLLQGKTAKETAASLTLSPRTVEYYFDNLKDKLECWNRSELFKAAQILEKLDLL